jgi:hypothetical protein
MQSNISVSVNEPQKAVGKVLSMKAIVLAVLLVSSVCAFGQAKFAGEYMGILTCSKGNAQERYLAQVFVYPDGRCTLSYWDFDWRLIATGAGTIDRKGKLEISVNNDLLKGMVNDKGSGTAAVTTRDLQGEKFRWTATFTRRYRDAYDPTEPQ